VAKVRDIFLYSPGAPKLWSADHWWSTRRLQMVHEVVPKEGNESFSLNKNEGGGGVAEWPVENYEI
jgi:hypothetical protein